MGLTVPLVDHTANTACDPERVAEVLAALASPSRLEIVRLLADGERDVTDIANRLSLSVANASLHLCRLRRAGLVIGRRDGTRIINRLAGSPARTCSTCAPPPAGPRHQRS